MAVVVRDGLVIERVASQAHRYAFERLSALVYDRAVQLIRFLTLPKGEKS